MFFKVTAELQDKRVPFEPGAAPAWAKTNTRQVKWASTHLPFGTERPGLCNGRALEHATWRSDSRAGIPAPRHPGGSVPKGRWVEAHLTCLVFVFAHAGAAPGFKWRPFVL